MFAQNDRIVSRLVESAECAHRPLKSHEVYTRQRKRIINGR